VSLTLGPNELELLRTAVRLLESTLGRDQADELRDVKELLRKLEARSGSGHGSPA
jgi:hypothetical protein